jgi:hypothetical protein
VAPGGRAVLRRALAEPGAFFAEVGTGSTLKIRSAQ